MAQTMDGNPAAWSQQEGAEEPKTNPSVPQQEEQPDVIEDEVIVDYDPDVDYEGSGLKIQPDVQKEKEENSDVEHSARG